MTGSKKLQKFYKGVILQKIHSYLNKDLTSYTINELDIFLKDYADTQKSTVNMTLDELKLLCEWSLYFANTIGLKIDYPKDELDYKLNLKIK